MASSESVSGSSCTAAFSSNFQRRLQDSAKESSITPQNLLNQFERFITQTSGAERYPKHSDQLTYCIWKFDIPIHFKKSSNFLECLTALQQNLEAAGYKVDTKHVHYQIEPGTYAILAELPHNCTSGCNRGGCYKDLKVTTCTDPNACAIAICLLNQQ